MFISTSIRCICIPNCLDICRMSNHGTPYLSFTVWIEGLGRVSSPLQSLGENMITIPHALWLHLATLIRHQTPERAVLSRSFLSFATFISHICIGRADTSQPAEQRRRGTMTKGPRAASTDLDIVLNALWINPLWGFGIPRRLGSLRLFQPRFNVFNPFRSLIAICPWCLLMGFCNSASGQLKWRWAGAFWYFNGLIHCWLSTSSPHPVFTLTGKDSGSKPITRPPRPSGMECPLDVAG